MRSFLRKYGAGIWFFVLAIALLTEPLWWKGTIEQLWIPALGVIVLVLSVRHIRSVVRRERASRQVELTAQSIYLKQYTRRRITDSRRMQRERPVRGFKRKGRRD